ncbi:MAG: outer-membrane lipoprotein carrier protein LolA, partial [Hydrogenovibrio sp.]|nr:outer-membrane lipoprotein carrier protein LolA [Hydrogenovibrio sp.]
EDNFNIIPERVNKGISWYNLVPKDNTFFQSLEVGIANNQLVQLWMYQSPDNVTKVVFSDIRQNQKIADNQFDFEPPQGVDVVGQRVESLK